MSLLSKFIKGSDNEIVVRKENKGMPCGTTLALFECDMCDDLFHYDYSNPYNMCPRCRKCQ